MSAAFQTFAGVDPHPDPFEKAAMLLEIAAIAARLRQLWGQAS